MFVYLFDSMFIISCIIKNPIDTIVKDFEFLNILRQHPFGALGSLRTNTNT